MDAGMGGRKIKAGLLLGAGLALARRIKKEESGPRVGVVLPPGGWRDDSEFGVCAGREDASELKFYRRASGLGFLGQAGGVADSDYGQGDGGEVG